VTIRVNGVALGGGASAALPTADPAAVRAGGTPNTVSGLDGSGDGVDRTVSDTLDLVSSTPGSMLVRTNGGGWQALSIGASGRVLSSDGSSPVWRSHADAGLVSTGNVTNVLYGTAAIVGQSPGGVVRRFSLRNDPGTDLAAGAGAGLAVELLGGPGGSVVEAGALDAVWETPAVGAESAAFVVRLRAGGVAHAEKLRVTSAGDVVAARTVVPFVGTVAQIEALSGVSAGAMAFATDAAGLSGAAVPCWWTGAAWVTATGAVLTD
jgi:hypothetical protein